MVTDNHYRWDFIGLSTDTKPTPSTSSKVSDGSTFYCSDNSKLYVWYKTQWYERTAPSSASSYTAGDGIVIENDEISADLAQTTGESTTKLMSQKAITDALASAGGVKELTTADYNWPTTGTKTAVALWLLPSGIYKGPASSSIDVYATRSQDYSMGAGFPSYAIVKECESDANNRAIVTYVDGTNGNVVEYYGIDSDGRNYSIKNFPNVVQTTGTSTTDVMSQNAVTSMVFADPATQAKIKIGAGTSTSEGSDAIEIGHNAYAEGTNAVALGYNAGADVAGAVALGFGTYAHGYGRIALGATSGSNDTTAGVMTIGSNNTLYGYNSSNYRLLTGLYDGQNAHDAVTVGQLNTRLGNLTITTISQTDYNNLQTKDPNTLYLITGA